MSAVELLQFMVTHFSCYLWVVLKTNLLVQQNQFNIGSSFPTETENQPINERTSPQISQKNHNPQKLAPQKLNDSTVFGFNLDI